MNKTIQVLDENGNNKSLEVIDVLAIENAHYVIVSSKDSENAHAYRAMPKGKEIEYLSIGAGTEFNKVLEAYTKKHKNE
ncbi:DUF1292 domain-containing protein [Haloimpatiens sp. FM7315]|uniref:DUF1292 domain-containing protein n=1 Tax=Haloimpatiens sp. FM7315 TaxID=3298609 RepID=UPI0035A36822